MDNADEAKPRRYKSETLNDIYDAMAILAEILNYADPGSPINEGAGGWAKLPGDVSLAIEKIKGYAEDTGEKDAKVPHCPMTLQEILEVVEGMCNGLHGTFYSFDNHRHTVEERLEISMGELEAVLSCTVLIRDGLRHVIGENRHKVGHWVEIPF